MDIFHASQAFATRLLRTQSTLSEADIRAGTRLVTLDGICSRVIGSGGARLAYTEVHVSCTETE